MEPPSQKHAVPFEESDTWIPTALNYTQRRLDIIVAGIRQLIAKECFLIAQIDAELQGLRSEFNYLNDLNVRTSLISNANQRDALAKKIEFLKFEILSEGNLILKYASHFMPGAIHLKEKYTLFDLRSILGNS